MQIHKTLILDDLRSQDEHDKAAQVDEELPRVLDSEQDAAAFEEFGINPMEMVTELAGGGGLGNVPGS